MKILRPLSPHLPFYKPQLTSTFPIFHRISGAFLATLVVFFYLLCLKMGLICFTYDNFYGFFFDSSKLILISVEITALALSYHLYNGLRHLLTDFDFGRKRFFPFSFKERFLSLLLLGIKKKTLLLLVMKTSFYSLLLLVIIIKNKSFFSLLLLVIQKSLSFLFLLIHLIYFGMDDLTSTIYLGMDDVRGTETEPDLELRLGRSTEPDLELRLGRSTEPDLDLRRVRGTEPEVEVAHDFSYAEERIRTRNFLSHHKILDIEDIQTIIHIKNEIILRMSQLDPHPFWIEQRERIIADSILTSKGMDYDMSTLEKKLRELEGADAINSKFFTKLIKIREHYRLFGGLS